MTQRCFEKMVQNLKFPQFWGGFCVFYTWYVRKAWEPNEYLLTITGDLIK